MTAICSHYDVWYEKNVAFFMFVQKYYKNVETWSKLYFRLWCAGEDYSGQRVLVYDAET